MKKHTGGWGVLPIFIFMLVLSGTILWSIAGVNKSHAGIPAMNAINQLMGQFRYLQASILNCVAAYPGGDNGGSYHLAYPRADTAVSASTITCPGTAANLFTGAGGLGYVGPVNGFGAAAWTSTGGWRYINDATSVRLSLTTDATTWHPVFANMVSQIGGPASTAGSPQTLTIVISY